jgi:hypothetical protein
VALRHAYGRRRLGWYKSPCFTGTKEQILTQKALAACDRAEVTVKASVFEDCGYNGGDCAHAWNDAVLSLEKCVFRYSSYGLGIDDGACVSVSRSTLHRYADGC